MAELINPTVTYYNLLLCYQPGDSLMWDEHCYGDRSVELFRILLTDPEEIRGQIFSATEQQQHDQLLSLRQQWQRTKQAPVSVTSDTLSDQAIIPHGSSGKLSTEIPQLYFMTYRIPRAQLETIQTACGEGDWVVELETQDKQHRVRDNYIAVAWEVPYWDDDPEVRENYCGIRMVFHLWNNMGLIGMLDEPQLMHINPFRGISHRQEFHFLGALDPAPELQAEREEARGRPLSPYFLLQPLLDADPRNLATAKRPVTPIPVDQPYDERSFGEHFPAMILNELVHEVDDLTRPQQRGKLTRFDFRMAAGQPAPLPFSHGPQLTRDGNIRIRLEDTELPEATRNKLGSTQILMRVAPNRRSGEPRLAIANQGANPRSHRPYVDITLTPKPEWNVGADELASLDYFQRGTWQAHIVCSLKPTIRCLRASLNFAGAQDYPLWQRVCNGEAETWGTGDEQPGFEHSSPYQRRVTEHRLGRLNPAQRQAVDRVKTNIQTGVSALHVIHGPPGTGKSTSISHILQELLHKDDLPIDNLRIMVCAASNEAVQGLASTFAQRFGLPDTDIPEFQRNPKIRPSMFVLGRNMKPELAPYYLNDFLNTCEQSVRSLLERFSTTLFPTTEDGTRLRPVNATMLENLVRYIYDDDAESLLGGAHLFGVTDAESWGQEKTPLEELSCHLDVDVTDPLKRLYYTLKHVNGLSIEEKATFQQMLAKRLKPHEDLDEGTYAEYRTFKKQYTALRQRQTEVLGSLRELSEETAPRLRAWLDRTDHDGDDQTDDAQPDDGYDEFVPRELTERGQMAGEDMDGLDRTIMPYQRLERMAGECASAITKLQSLLPRAQEEEDSAEDTADQTKISMESIVSCKGPQRYKLFFSTLSNVGSSGLQGMEENGIDILIVDEAGQATVPDVLIPLERLRPRQVILVGDDRQLPATIKDRDNNPYVMWGGQQVEAGLGQSLIMHMDHQILLDQQARMHPALSEFPNEMFYEGALDNSPYVKSRDPILLQVPDLFVNIRTPERSGKSKTNAGEAEAIASVMLYLRDKMGINVVQQVSIISLYKKQIDIIKEKLEEAGITGVEIRSVDGFQGRENDIILISTVRCNNESNVRRRLGFSEDKRRMNVALTRARFHRIIFGNVDTLTHRNAPICSALARYFTDIQGDDAKWRAFIESEDLATRMAEQSRMKPVQAPAPSAATTANAPPLPPQGTYTAAMASSASAPNMASGAGEADGPPKEAESKEELPPDALLTYKPGTDDKLGATL